MLKCPTLEQKKSLHPFSFVYVKIVSLCDFFFNSQIYTLLRFKLRSMASLTDKHMFTLAAVTVRYEQALTFTESFLERF